MELPLVRWLHFLFGIMWIGILYYFNFVQVQALAQANAAADGSAKGITKFVAPRALEYFRWSALGTWIFGAALLGQHFGSAFGLQSPYAAIGVGAWLGSLMLINVWAIIYPNQMRALGFVEGLTDEQKAKSRRLAFLMSRTNTMLSIPMLFFMAFGFTHRAVVGL
ncbi:MAG TPA: urate hydroxylase PuuD [Candidatus Acidoferrales bacterium]|nr:urate hydroxylase PuuD [Candidatus Acidoferrales bacterium]